VRLSEFDYNLPKELIAQYPALHRDESRMMVLDKKRQDFKHKNFKDILSYLSKGDCLVLNNTKVINARLVGKRETGGKAEIFILEELGNNIYKALLKPSAKLKDKKIYLQNNIHAKILKAENPESVVEFDRKIDLNMVGKIPLPPYIKRNPIGLDKTRYQTVFADKVGATASPTAGLHFTQGILDEIKKREINVIYVTLHVSYGTFAPVLEENIEVHKMHREYFELSKEAISDIRNAKSKGKKIVAVGTTTTRVLEANAEVLCNENSLTHDIDGWTDLFIYPGYKFRVIDSLLTNFHLPKSTLLLLVSAFTSKKFILKVYEEAIKDKYRFFSYGDCMLIL